MGAVIVNILKILILVEIQYVCLAKDHLSVGKFCFLCDSLMSTFCNKIYNNSRVFLNTEFVANRNKYSILVKAGIMSFSVKSVIFLKNPRTGRFFKFVLQCY